MAINHLIQSLLGQLQGKNPQGYRMITGMINNGGNPDAFLKQVLGQVTPEQKQNILNTAKGYGVPESYLSKIQNMK